MKKTISIAACLVLAAGMPAAAQNNDVAPGLKRARATPAGTVIDALGDVKFGPVNIEGAVTPLDNGILGVEHAWGHFWVSGRAGGTATTHKIYKFDKNGVFVAEYTQTSANAAWGGRDGAANEAANKLYFGEESGLMNEYDYNPGTGNITWNRTINLGAASPFLATTIRAITFRPSDGMFFMANFGSPIHRFKIDPIVYDGSVPNTTPIYGVGYDESDNTIWTWDQNTGGLTGVRANQWNAAAPHTQLPGTFMGAPNGVTANIAGGADVYCGDPHNPGKRSLVGIHQSEPDSLFVYDIATNCAAVCYPDCNLDGLLNLADFGCFQTAFATGNMYADCNGDTVLNLADFGCFQTKFAIGCP